jgi:hypothetical protein
MKLYYSLSTLLFFLAANSSSAQTMFIDSSKYYTFQKAPSISEGVSFAMYFRENIYLDSINSNGEFYTVKLNAYFPEKNLEYKLRCYDSQVFYSGVVLELNSQDTFMVYELLIYNFKLKAQDTFRIQFPKAMMNITLVIDSVKEVTYLDGQKRLTQFFTMINNQHQEFLNNTLKFGSMGLGSNTGLVPFKILDRFVYEKVLISVCSNDNAIYKNNDRFDSWNPNDYCDDDDIYDMVLQIRKVSIDDISKIPLTIVPCPTNNYFKIELPNDNNSWEIQVMDMYGKQVLNTEVLNNWFDCSSWPSGVYTIQLLDTQNHQIHLGRISVQH